MIKTLHILPTLDPLAGGLSQAVRNMIGYAADEDISHEVLCLDDPAASFLSGSVFAVHALGKGRTAWSYSGELDAWLKNNIWRYHRIVVHGLWQYQSYAAVRAWRNYAASDAKLYVMPHGMLDPYFQKAKERRWKALRNLFFWQLVERNLVNSADGLLFTTKDEELLARDTFRPYQPKSTFVIGLGVKSPPSDRLFFMDVPRGYWLYLGRLHPKKGGDMLINSYLKMKAAGYELPALVIAGPGLETPYGRSLMQLSAGEPKVVFPGMLEGDAKWAAFYGAGLFILPSHQENFGIAVVEALACSVPVLISDKVNICSMVIDAAAGLVVPDTDSGILKGLKDWMGLSEELRQEMRISAESLYLHSFSEDAAASNTIALFKS